MRRFKARSQIPSQIRRPRTKRTPQLYARHLLTRIPRKSDTPFLDDLRRTRPVDIHSNTHNVVDNYFRLRYTPTCSLITFRIAPRLAALSARGLPSLISDRLPNFIDSLPSIRTHLHQSASPTPLFSHSCKRVRILLKINTIKSIAFTLIPTLPLQVLCFLFFRKLHRGCIYPLSY